MQKIKKSNRLKSLKISGERGASLSGYGLIVGLIAVVALTAVSDVGTQISRLFGEVATTLGFDVATESTGSGSGGGSGGGGGGEVGDGIPDPVDFTDVTSAVISVVEESNIIQITGMGFGVPISISGPNNPEYRICFDVSCATATPYLTNASTMVDDLYVQIRGLVVSSSTTETFVLAVGVTNIDWNVTTIAFGGIASFSNCSQTGLVGPSQGQCDSAYSGLPDTIVTVNAGIQSWVVPVTGTYLIEVEGAQGGDSSTSIGLFGAKVLGEVILTVGQQIDILVGQRGGDHFNGQYASGGGGGTYVVLNSDQSQPLIAAGGGGGVQSAATVGAATGVGQDTTAGGVGGNNGGAGGINGSGGNIVSGGAGGGGYLSNGQTANIGTNDAVGGSSYSNGGTGGTGATCAAGGGDGGFGGGGGGEWCQLGSSGGGGGYSGGGGGGQNTTGHGGGGGSYTGASVTTSVPIAAGVNSGHGSVVITIQ